MLIFKNFIIFNFHYLINKINKFAIILNFKKIKFEYKNVNNKRILIIKNI